MRRRLIGIALGMLGAGGALDTLAAEPAPAAYEDRVLDSEPQAAVDASEEEPADTGWPRGTHDTVCTTCGQQFTQDEWTHHDTCPLCRWTAARGDAR